MPSKSEPPATVKEKVDMAIGRLKMGYSCSESVLLTYGPRLGLDQQLAVKIASGFGGGMALMGETCGAVTAAYMVIGLKYGATSVKDGYARDITYESVAHFAELFKARHGSTRCRDLIGGIDISTVEGRRHVRENGRVPQIVSAAIILLEELFRGNE
jgi:C_GCAxxG_C_C family probable redox protein